MVPEDHVSNECLFSNNREISRFILKFFFLGNTTFLNVTTYSIGAKVAIVKVLNPMKYEDERTFIGYQYLHMEDPDGNATKHGYRPCDDGYN